jgi:hypothetical protein
MVGIPYITFAYFYKKIFIVEISIVEENVEREEKFVLLWESR